MAAVISPCPAQQQACPHRQGFGPMGGGLDGAGMVVLWLQQAGSVCPVLSQEGPPATHPSALVTHAQEGSGSCQVASELPQSLAGPGNSHQSGTPAPATLPPQAERPAWSLAQRAQLLIQRLQPT